MREFARSVRIPQLAAQECRDRLVVGVAQFGQAPRPSGESALARLTCVQRVVRNSRPGASGGLGYGVSGVGSAVM